MQQLGPASLVRGVGIRLQDGTLRVVIDTNGSAQFKDFTLAGPSRIVIDLTGVRSASGSRTIPVGTGLVERVRVGEPAPGAVRIVIDVKVLTRYRVIRDESSLIVVIGDDSATAGPG